MEASVGETTSAPYFSIVVPAYNEAGVIDGTLRSLSRAVAMLQETAGQVADIIVIDNASSDDTAERARQAGVVCVQEPTPGIGGARNAGARQARGRYLVFVDADVEVSVFFLTALHAAIERDSLLVGAPTAIYRPQKLLSWLICAYWDWSRSRGGAAQGVGQFYERELFFRLRGFDPSLKMSEDVDLYARAAEWCSAAQSAPATIVGDSIIWPSTRRYDRWSNARMLLMQSPFVAKLFLRSPRFWRGWRERAIR